MARTIHEYMPGIRWVEIPNGDVMDDPTNMFIVGTDPVILVDPGSNPGLNAVIETLEQLANPGVDSILLTHVHVDHGESADEVRRLFDAPVRFHEAELPELERSKHDSTLDQPLEHGEVVEFSGFRFEAVLTPGHAEGHLSFIEIEQNFGLVGDLITGWGSSAIFPPWGDLSDYLDSMRLIADRGTNPLLPSHGDPVTNGPQALRHFVKRRIEREREILEILDAGPMEVESIRDTLYSSIPQDLENDVTGNVILHLEKLERDGLIERVQGTDCDLFTLAQENASRRQ